MTKTIAPAGERGRQTQQGYTPFAGFRRLFADTATELRKVQWPDRTTTRNLTLVVIGMSVALSVVLGAFDLALTRLVEWLIRTVG